MDLLRDNILIGGIDGVVLGDPVLVPGIFGQALKLNGRGQSVDLGPHP